MKSDGRFTPGYTPWNKGIAKSVSGRRSYRWVPIGSERVDTRGYLLRKVTDTGNAVADWKQVHKLVWEEANGPVPAGRILRFRDGNKMNVLLDNLELQTRTEQMARNSVTNLPPELQEVIRLKAQLTRKIHEHDR
ncbi:HNH endonuclease signature motif containing protein [Burkholderia ubonensis]|uniref:HNH endonuclease signature motif containing protein n=1 Tax=Burkholderia ubonensis TaxID=101571 RepID=UPI0009B445E9|nr:HNH endonuclease signature motif containing protein [Burkholderia ubonensis]